LLAEEFADSFSDADEVFLLDIYAASEPPIPGVTADALAEKIRSRRPVTRLAPDEQDALRERLRPGDVLLTLGAGDVWKWGEALLAAPAAARSA
jgi:UDP-N-acetylmuramate--alanine ligase